VGSCGGVDDPNDHPRDRDETRRRGVSEYNTSSSVMVVIEGDEPRAPTHTRSTTRWSENCARTPHTSSTSGLLGRYVDRGRRPSIDGKAAYVQAYIAGDQGEAIANESVQAVRDMSQARKRQRA